MNWNPVYAACLFAALNVVAISAQAEADLKAENYSYGTHLDIQKVLSSVDEGGASCEVVDAHLTYLNSQGQKRVLDYRKFAEACNLGG
ncbi:DUF2790 domain-containing protein [Pseudomonas fluorescens]|uniref:DUF2790 domain-containing protein n=1 Tax=Pseudomonas fluorescens TaxID=294 RepID=A0A5E7EX73_PSEFL|nr:DUF2790 domain-containing protein [Pseudomonas fluorescens]VVO31761.1 hypothetical protein PS723_05049 [Pseudomonas fluorescens]